MTETIELRDAERLSQQEFERDYYRGNRPVVIAGAVAHWQALGRWSRGYFESLFGDRVVPIDYSQDGFMTYTALSKEANTKPTQMTFREAAAEICTEDPDRRRCYLRNVSLPDYFPELLEDFEPPALIGDPQRITMNHFWYGAPGCVTALHFDWTNNLLVQIQGRKHVTLFPASQTPFLYPGGNAPREGDTIDLREHSLLDIERPDYERFPLFCQARPMTAVLGPGHMLWLPPNWWHQMRSLDVSISVNFWWTPHLDQILFMQELVDRMPEAYDTGALEDYLLRATETRDFTDLIDMAARCCELGKDCAAVLIAAAALEQHLRRLLRKHGIEEQGGPRSLRGEGLNARLAQAGVAAAAADRDMRRWLPLIARAKAMDDERLDADEVTDMLGRLRALIQTGP